MSERVTIKNQPAVVQAVTATAASRGADGMVGTQRRRRRRRTEEGSCCYITERVNEPCQVEIRKEKCPSRCILTREDSVSTLIMARKMRKHCEAVRFKRVNNIHYIFVNPKMTCAHWSHLHFA